MSLIDGDLTKFEPALKKLNRYGSLVGGLAYVAGIVYFLMFPHDALVGRTYISENALLPGLVSSNIYSSDLFSQHYDQIKTHYESQKSKKIDAEFLRDLFLQNTNNEAFTQRFNVTNPFSVVEEFTSGKNVYAFSRAQRADGTESIVVSAPLALAKGKPNLAGIAQMFVISDLVRRHPYWAKDLIFVVYDMNDVGMQAWINSYYDINSEYISGESLKQRAGSIQAALNLEFRTTNVDKLVLKLEGPNGKLPNLDLFNTVIRICRTIGFECSLDSEQTSSLGSYNHHYNNDRPPLDHATGVENTFKMVLRQASGMSSASHGYFLNHRIEALTIQGAQISSSKQSRKPNYKQNMLKTMRIIESTLRSVNNLLERFHQSFFFYLLPSSNFYVSIGTYMPAFGLVMLPVLVQLIQIWCSLLFNNNNNNNNNNNKDDSVVNASNNQSTMLSTLATFVLPTLGLIAVADGLIINAGTNMFTLYGHSMGLEAKHSLVVSYILMTLFGFLTPAMTAITRRTTVYEVNVFKLAVLMKFLIVLGTLSLINFSLAFLVALVYVPLVSLIARRAQNKLVKFVQVLAACLASPLVIVTVLYAAFSFYTGTLSTHNVLERLPRLLDTLMSGAYELALASKLSSVWTFDLVNVFFMPIWTSLCFMIFLSD